MQITPISCLTDNYAYIINNNTYKTIGVVDPSEASPIINFLKKNGLYEYKDYDNLHAWSIEKKDVFWK